MSDVLYQALFRIMREGTSLGDGHDVNMTRAASIADEALRAHAQAIEARRAATLGAVHESAVATPCAEPFSPLPRSPNNDPAQ